MQVRARLFRVFFGELQIRAGRVRALVQVGSRIRYRDGKRNFLNGGSLLPHLGGSPDCPCLPDFFQKAFFGERFFLLLADMLCKDAQEFVMNGDITLGKQDLQGRVDEIEMDDGIAQAFFRRHEFRRNTGQRKRRIAPAVLEDAVNLIEEEQQAVPLVERQLHLAGAECLDGNDVGAGKLQDEHAAVGVNLEHAAVLLVFDGQRKMLANLEIGIIAHGKSPLLCSGTLDIVYHILFLLCDKERQEYKKKWARLQVCLENL